MMDSKVLQVVPQDELDNLNTCYLAWFSVCTGSGVDGEGKVRIVFNAAGKSGEKISLKACLTAAPEITSSILNATFAFMVNRYVTTRFFAGSSAR